MKLIPDGTEASTLERRVQEVLRDPRNMGEMRDADAVGSVSNSSCGEFMRIWVKFKEQDGRKVIEFLKPRLDDNDREEHGFQGAEKGKRRLRAM